jgi:hypothetical protein
MIQISDGKFYQDALLIGYQENSQTISMFCLITVEIWKMVELRPGCL